MQLRQPQRADDDDVAIVAVGRGCRSAGETGVGGLQDDDLVGRDAGAQHAPLFDQRTGTHHRQCCAADGAKTVAETFRPVRLGQDVRVTDDGSK
jgi:hypothetical protein